MSVTTRFVPLEAELSTERLTLSPFQADDAVAYAALWTARGGEPATPEQVLARIPTLEARLAEQCLGLRVLRLAGERWPIGYAALIPGRASVDEPEIVSELLPAVHGHGFATEAGRALIDAAWRTGRERLWATTRPDNRASLRVAEKLGFVAHHIAVDDRGEIVWSVRERPVQ
jgi:RimJ/RimL family protein N-acetyltransferase